MKSKINGLLSSRGRHLAFAFACLLIASAGWAAKVAVDRLGELQDEMESDFKRPSLIYAWSVLERQKINSPILAPPAMPAPGVPEVSALPTDEQ